jgi:hypothetical protein
MGIFDAIKNHPSFSSAVGGAVVGSGAVAIAGAVRRRSKKTTKKTTKKKTRKTTKSRKTKRKTTTSFKRRRAKAFRGARPKKIYKTKNGQPYIKLKSGKARFISKRTAKLMKKRKGGFS